MNKYRADLHIHSVLSPCGDLEMSPLNIVKKALKLGLDIIAVTDHNHTGHCKLTRKLGEKYGIYVVYGAEVNTSEEVHCLAFFDTDYQLGKFQNYIDDNLPNIANDRSLFGDQILVDEDEIIQKEIQNSLYPGLKKGIEEICDFVHALGGLFLPAHVDRRSNGIFAQLGFLPENLKPDAVEIFRNTERDDVLKSYPELNDFQLLKSSDAHFIDDVGRCYSILLMEKLSFSEFSDAVKGINGRKVLMK